MKQIYATLNLFLVANSGAFFIWLGLVLFELFEENDQKSFDLHNSHTRTHQQIHTRLKFYTLAYLCTFMLTYIHTYTFVHKKACEKYFSFTEIISAK